MSHAPEEQFRRRQPAADSRGFGTIHPVARDDPVIGITTL
jgi:hypothetical protein